MKRRLERKRLSETVSFMDIRDNSPAGEVVDITIEGLMTVLDKQIPTNAVYQYEMQLPEEIKGQSSITIGVDCLWCRQADNFRQYWAGFQIIDASDESIDILEELISKYAVN